MAVIETGPHKPLASSAGFTTLYARAPRLLESLQHARGDGSHLKLLDKLSRVQLLIVDDFLLTPLSEWERRDILEVAEGRYDAGATVIARPMPHQGLVPRYRRPHPGGCHLRPAVA